MKNPFLWLSGVNKDVLERCPSESFKYAALGGTVATTSALAAFSAYKVSHTFLHLSVELGLIMAIFWGVAILNLDRWLLATLSRQATRRATLTIAIPRVFLAILIGLVVSLVVMLDVFHSEVRRQAVSNVQRAAEADRRDRATDYAQIDVLQAERSRLEVKLAAPPSPEILNEDELYVRWLGDIETLEAEIGVAERDAIAAVGTPLYSAKQDIVARLLFREKQTRLAAQKRKVLLLERATQTKALQNTYDRDRLTAIDTQLEGLEQQKAVAEKNAIEAYASAPANLGLLDTIEALWTLGVDRNAIMIALIIGCLIILTIDSLPVAAKTLLLVSSDPSLYDRTVGTFEEEKFKDYESEVAIVAERRRLAHQFEVHKLGHEYDGRKIELDADAAAQQTAHQIVIDQAKAQIKAERDAIKAEADAEAKIRSFQYEVAVDEARVTAELQKKDVEELARQIVAVQRRAVEKYIVAYGVAAEASVEAQIQNLEESAPAESRDVAAEAARAAPSNASAGGPSTLP